MRSRKYFHITPLPVTCPFGCLGGCQFSVIQFGLFSTATGVRSRGAVLGAVKCNNILCKFSL